MGCNNGKVTHQEQEEKEVADSSSADSFLIQLKTILTRSVNDLANSNPNGSTTMIPDSQSHRLAQLILQSMETPGRVYHSLEHVFGIITEGQMTDDPILLLSALFHDVIYYTIDQTFLPEQARALEGVLDDEKYQSERVLSLLPHIDDPLLQKVVQLYGLQAGQALPKSGTNEFLSAIIGVTELSPWLDELTLLKIATCIEATIPFRPTNEQGQSPMDRLYQRLVHVVPDGTDETWIVSTVRKAAQMANGDLCSFDSLDRDFFLDSSWKLLPEARPRLLETDCPLSDYFAELGRSLPGRTKFLTGAVRNIFQHFGNEPSDAVLERKQAQTRENLRLVAAYAQIRTLQLQALVGFCLLVGDDPTKLPARPLLNLPLVPSSAMSAVMDAKTTNGVVVVAESATTATSNNNNNGKNGQESFLTTAQEAEIRHWLVTGRRTGFEWDPPASPLAAVLWDDLGGMEGVAAQTQATAALQQQAQSQSSETNNNTNVIRPEVEWLQTGALSPATLTRIASSLARVWPDRAVALQTVVLPQLLGASAKGERNGGGGDLHSTTTTTTNNNNKGTTTTTTSICT
mmetsp:Transcript_15055/g.32873  ORF Transcript_15055/g.32873 Transcript_15055/m.32873 type:complete len:573 (-) Transcript_15055:47-1765(-)|eukprot:CAMPEP_0168733116 /NCGR_PEP_ID=MMETSP0724-20121128/8120_1 /TAXON_ID=265536 /ORGANISM="Amphiprora sp., Strain CCMP467" /LENGTH=572 /DNA_ID=CAMNT_0008780155 /DNA_START=143 /DNA_END=1861 /DNA_ORIENTATION=-